MTDLFDRAREHEDEMRDDALEEQARRSGLRGKTFDDSSVICQVCEESIPLARRRALPGVQTCIDCQEDLERAR